MQPDEVRRQLQETGALLSGHFLLSSGLHSEQYVQCAQLLAWPARAALLGCAIGELWQDDNVDVVIGPAMGGIIIAHEVARFLGTPCLFSERDQGKMTLRRGFAVEPGSRALVVEDVVTTGKSVREVLSLLQSLKVEPVGVSSIIWRAPEETEGGPKSPFGALTFRTLLPMEVDARPPRECDPCRDGKPFEKPGSRPLTTAPKQNAS